MAVLGVGDGQRSVRTAQTSLTGQSTVGKPDQRNRLIEKSKIDPGDYSVRAGVKSEVSVGLTNV